MHFQNITLTTLYLSIVGYAHPTRRLVSNNPVVEDKIHNINYQGTSSGDIESFLNIKFGQDTGGSNRFAPPQSFSYPSGSIVNASAPGAACPQQMVPVPGLDIFSNVTMISEDCLTLRIDRPTNTTADAKLPVLLWVYGGGDTIGQIYDQAYDPTGLVVGSAQKGMPIIFAAMNYRVGFFGFSAFEENNSTAVPNVGLLDQRLGMEWIQKNIASFGGDPENVTIFGESDGGTGVGLQVVAYGGTKPAPFKRAITESGSATADPGIASNFTWENTAELTYKLNCSNTNSDIGASVECLREIPLDNLLPTEVNYTFAIDSFSGFDVFIPVVDHSFIPAPPSQLLRSGNFSKGISTIIGWNENDGSIFTAPPTQFINSSSLEMWLSEQYPGLNKSNVQTALDLYSANSSSFIVTQETYPALPIDWIRASQMTRDVNDVCPALLMAQSMAIHNLASSNTSTYLYALNDTLFSSFLAAANASYEGVTHFSDIPYVFNQATAFNVSEEEVTLASQISGSWVEFAYYGQPTAPIASGKSMSASELSSWPAAIANNNVSSGNDVAIRVIGSPGLGVFNAGPELDVEEDFEQIGRRCAFWNSPEILEALHV